MNEIKQQVCPTTPYDVFCRIMAMWLEKLYVFRRETGAASGSTPHVSSVLIIVAIVAIATAAFVFAGYPLYLVFFSFCGLFLFGAVLAVAEKIHEYGIKVPYWEIGKVDFFDPILPENLPQQITAIRMRQPNTFFYTETLWGNDGKRLHVCVGAQSPSAADAEVIASVRVT